MCGIAGWFAKEAPRHSTSVLKAMTDAIAHRGPDDSGEFSAVTAGGAQVALGHRRLSIIDLATGHQPMVDPESGLVVVFNGEIYNFRSLRAELAALGDRFATASDTEVILLGYRRWGADVLRRLSGMFAFAIWDPRSATLFLARDRFGKKPLFVARAGSTLYFASEVKALLAVPSLRPRVDPASLRDYLLYRYVPGPATLLEGIEKLPAGTWMSIGPSGVRCERYYDLPDRRRRSAARVPARPGAEFGRRLADAVTARMVSDVPFGAFLSGGIDSSAVVAMMSRVSAEPVRTFSVGFAEAAISEHRYARIVAERFGTKHEELLVSADDLAAQLERCTWHRDAPVSEPADIPIYLLSVAARREVKMVLTGEGADEVLGGYPKHRAEHLGGALLALPGAVRSALLQPLADAMPYRLGKLAIALSAFAAPDERQRLVRWFGAMSEDEVARLAPGLARRGSHGTAADRIDDGAAGCVADRVTEGGAAGVGGRVTDDVAAGLADAYCFSAERANSRLRRLLFFDQSSWLPDNLLERGDRMTMAASLEARMPFMSHEIAEWVSALPDRFRVRGGHGKWLLYAAMRDVLPSEILQRPKSGFRMPLATWFRTTMREFVADRLLSANANIGSYVDARAVARLVTQHLDGARNHEKAIWMLLALEVWLRGFTAGAARAQRPDDARRERASAG